jgi:hypothetical protein
MTKLITILGLALVLITSVAAISSARADRTPHDDFCRVYKQKPALSGAQPRWGIGIRCPSGDG